MHIASWGDERNPTILLLHGMRDSARSWDWTANAISNRFHVVAPDLRGHGDSDWASAGAYTISDFVYDLAVIVDQLALHDVIILGHSLGGAIALRYAAAWPEIVKALCLIECIELPLIRQQRNEPSSYPRLLRNWVELEAAAAKRQPRCYADLEQAKARYAASHSSFDANTLDHLVRHSVRALAQGGYRWKYDNSARHRAPEDADGKDLDEILSVINCPTLLCYGSKSWIPLPPEERLARIKNHQLTLFQEGGHWLHHECRDDFLNKLTAFLQLLIQEKIYA